MHTIKRSPGALVVASKETSLEVKAEKSKYMIMSGGQNEGQNQNIKTDNSSFERVEEFQYWKKPKRIKIPFRKIQPIEVREGLL